MTKKQDELIPIFLHIPTDNKVYYYINNNIIFFYFGINNNLRNNLTYFGHSLLDIHSIKTINNIININIYKAEEFILINNENSDENR